MDAEMRTAHQSNNCYEFSYDRENDYTNNGLENDMTVYVKTISGKTIVRCNKKQRAETIAETVERKSSDSTRLDVPREPRKSAERKETIEENDIGMDTTVVMSFRMLGGMETNETMDTQET